MKNSIAKRAVSAFLVVTVLALSYGQLLLSSVAAGVTDEEALRQLPFASRVYGNTTGYNDIQGKPFVVVYGTLGNVNTQALLSNLYRTIETNQLTSMRVLYFEDTSDRDTVTAFNSNTQYANFSYYINNQNGAIWSLMSNHGYTGTLSPAFMVYVNKNGTVTDTQVSRADVDYAALGRGTGTTVRPPYEVTNSESSPPNTSGLQRAVYNINKTLYDTQVLDTAAQTRYTEPTTTDSGIRNTTATVTSGRNGFAKVLAVHDWAADNIYYDLDGKSNDKTDAADVMANRRGNALGISNLTVEMLRQSGIPAKLVSGFAIGSNVNSAYSGTVWTTDDISKPSNHYWVEAYVNSKWWAVDVVYDSSNRYQNGKNSANGSSTRAFFCPALYDFSATHRIVSYPYASIQLSQRAEKPLAKTVLAKYKELRATESVSSPAKYSYTLPSDGIQSDNATIVATAAAITKNKTSTLEKARAIHDWVAAYVAFDTDMQTGRTASTYTSAADVMNSGRAVGAGYANLTAAMLRAAHIPAKVVTGFALSSASFTNAPEDWTNSNITGTDANHAWVEAFADTRWITIDTAFDSGNVYKSGSTKQGPVKQTYFNIADEYLAGDHRIVSLPNYTGDGTDLYPKGLDVVQNGNTVTVSWNKVGNTSYRLCYATNYVGWNIKDGTAASYTFDVQKGQLWHFTVLNFDLGTTMSWGGYAPVSIVTMK